eukprot:TRINITY_DN47033_c0_g1_i1.p1 TRINITY_DN47033_c0_g1~~TRINITY_DN47033_c0_g1_i1.p1  ORF type:complete len:372 (+),score=79.91 TRINITY_DN47033_c0_g1_i1:64-1179(+)
MPVTAQQGGGPGGALRQQQLALLDVQRRWVASMVAKGHKGGGWFKVKERALMKNQRTKMQAVDPGMQAEVAGDLMGLLKEHRMAPWASQLANVGITTLLALKNVQAESELPQGMPPPTRRVLLGEIQRMNSLGYTLPVPAPVHSPSVSPVSSPSLAPVQSPPPSSTMSYQIPQSLPVHQPRVQYPPPTSSPPMSPPPGKIDEMAIRNPNDNQLYEITKPDEYAAAPQKLVVCGVNGCTRKFSVNRVETHRKACAESGKKRQVFKIEKHRITEEAEVARKEDPIETKKKSKWREQSRSFRAVCGRTTSEPEEPIADDRVTCPACGRKFNQSAAERHIPHCTEKMRYQQRPTATNRSNTSPPTRATHRPAHKF